MEEERSFERLYEEAGNLADNVLRYSENDQEELEMLSAVISQYRNLSSPKLWNLLDSYTNVGMMSRIELLLPGDVVLTSGGESVDASGLLSFEAEAAKGIHITNREIDIIHRDTYVARHYVPCLLYTSYHSLRGIPGRDTFLCVNMGQISAEKIFRKPQGNRDEKIYRKGQVKQHLGNQKPYGKP